jgi:nicotinate-nucleotide adenylyltransferase
MQISASYIRKCLKAGKSVQYLVPDAVYRYLEEVAFYR